MMCSGLWSPRLVRRGLKLMLRSSGYFEMSYLTKPLEKVEIWRLQGRETAASLTYNWVFRLALTPGLQTTILNPDGDLQSPNLASLIPLLPPSLALKGSPPMDKSVGT